MPFKRRFKDKYAGSSPENASVVRTLFDLLYVWCILPNPLLPDHEVGVDDLVGETELTDADALQHSVAGELVHDQRSIGVTGLLDFIGDDATDEVRVSRV